MANASNIIKIYKLKKSAAVAGAVVLSTMAVDSVLSKKANKFVALGVKSVVGIATAIATEKLVNKSYVLMNDLSLKMKEKADLMDDELPEEEMEITFEEDDDLTDFVEE